MQVHELDFTGLGWTNVDDLIAALSTTSDDGHGRACPNLRYVWLFNNPIDEPEKAYERLSAVLGDDCKVCGLVPQA